MLLASLAEMLSIGAVLPFLGALATPEILYEHRAIQPIVNHWGISRPKDLLLPATILFATSIILAATVRILLVWLQAKFCLGIVNELATKAYFRALNQPYSFHISTNSSEIVAAILSKVSGAIGGTLSAVLVIVSSQLILWAVLTVLIVANPLIAISSLLGVGVSYSLIFLLTKKRLAFASTQLSQSSARVIRSLQEGLGGIRDVLLDGTQRIHSGVYGHADAELRKAQASIQIISNSPRFVIESVGMLVIAGIAYALNGRPGGFVPMIPIIGALAVGAQKMLPLAHQSYSCWAQIVGHRDSLKDALDLLDQTVVADTGFLTCSPELAGFQKIYLDRVNFRYDSNSPYVLENIRLAIPKGARIGFIGETGSGKSTLADIIMGLLQPSDGRLMIDNVCISAENCRAWYKCVAHVPQSIFLSDDTIAANIAFGVPASQIDMKRVKSAAKQAQISRTIESSTKQYNTVVGERGVKLSGGQRQRIGIARALYKQADVIIFDEATSALDNETEDSVMRAIDGLANHLTVLIIAHRLTTLKYCSQIVELENGKLKRIGSYPEIVGLA